MLIHHNQVGSINRINNKNHMIISIDTDKAFDKIHHLFMLKTFIKLVIKGTYLKIIGVIYDKPTTNIILTRQKLESFLFRTGISQECLSHASCSVQFWQSQAEQLGKRNKRYLNRTRGKSKYLYLQMISFYTQRTSQTMPEATQTHKRRQSSFRIKNKCKKKSVAFLYIHNIQAQN